MRLSISKLIISKLIIIVLLLLTGLGIGIKVVNAQSYVYFEGDVGSVVAFQSPTAEGCIYNEGTNSPYNSPLWIKWQDKNAGSDSNTRYTFKPAGTHCYSFPSWQAIGEDGRNKDYFTYIKPDQPNEQAIEDIIQTHPGEYYSERGYVRKASTGNNDNFGCSENSHVITAVLPAGDPGSFTSGVAGNIDVNNDLITQSFPDIYYKAPTNKPKGLTATCPAPGTTANLSWQAADTTAGYSYLLRVDKDPDSWGGRATINPGDVLNDNASSPYSLSSEPSKNYKWWVHACRPWGCSDQETSNFSCGSCPSAPSAQTPPNGDTIACTATAVDLSWTGPAGSVYNLRVDGEGARPASGTANNCSPHTICINGYTQETMKINIQPGKTYTWWVDIQAPNTCGYLTTGTKTFSTASCTAPRIDSLQIRDAQTNTQKDGQRISGRSVDQGGSGFNNPLLITLNATAGQAKTTSYFVAFYNQSDGILSDLSKFPSFKNQDSSTLQTRLNDLKNGVLLRYDEDTGGTNKKYYVWARNKWIDLSGYSRFGLPLCNAQNIPGDCNDSNRLYTVFPRNNPRQWGLRFDKNFGDKTMFTTAVVSDSNNLSAPFKGGDITPE